MRRAPHVLVAWVLTVFLSAGSLALADQNKVQVQDDVAGTCPPGFVVVRDVAGHPSDKNGNGIVCATSDSSSGSKPAGPKPEASPGAKPTSQKPDASKKPEGSTTTKPAGTEGPRRLEVTDDTKGTCPPGFTLARDVIPRPEDQNRNGLVCVRLK